MNNLEKIYIGNMEFYIPFHIAQLSAEQFLVLLSISKMDSSIEQTQLLLFISLLESPVNWVNVMKLRWFWLKNLKIIPLMDWLTFGKFTWKKQVIDPETLSQKAEMFTKFYFADNFELTSNPIKKLYKKRFNWFRKRLRIYDSARPDTLSDFKLKDFIETEEAYFNFITQKDEDSLTKIIQVLYKNPKIKTHDHTPNVRRAIQLYYEGCKNFIVETFPETYRTEWKNNSKNTTDNNPFMSMVHVLAKEDPSQYESITNSALWDCLYATEQKMKIANQTP